MAKVLAHSTTFFFIDLPSPPFQCCLVKTKWSLIYFNIVLGEGGAFKVNIRNKLQVWISVYYVEWGVVNHLLRGGMRYDPSKNKYVTWRY